jgi:IS4 transposase
MNKIKHVIDNQEDIDRISVGAAREYISDMLNELCAIAEQSGQKDVEALLRVTYQAVRVSKSEN